MMTLVYIIHLIGPPLLCGGLAFVALVLALRLLVGIDQAWHDVPGKPGTGRNRSRGADPQKSGKRSLIAYPHGLRFFQNNRIYDRRGLSQPTQKLKGLYLFQILKRKCHCLTGGRPA